MFSLRQQQHIQQVLQEEVGCANRLLQSLDLEYNVLAQRHVEKLEHVVRDKQEIIRQLEQVSIQREKILESFAAVKDSSQQDNTDRFDGNQQLAGLWNNLVELAEKCREKNRINGRIIELVSKQSANAMDILHGILPGTSATSELYDNHGHTTKAINKRSLVQV